MPPTVHRCATSRKRLEPSISRSILLIWAFWAARCACRRRRTRCSGDSPGMRGALGAAADPPTDFEVAWGMVDVKRVASLTLRGPILDAMAGVAKRRLRLRLVLAIFEEREGGGKGGGRANWADCARSEVGGWRVCGLRGREFGMRGKWCHEIFAGQGGEGAVGGPNCGAVIGAA